MPRSFASALVLITAFYVFPSDVVSQQYTFLSIHYYAVNGLEGNSFQDSDYLYYRSSGIAGVTLPTGPPTTFAKRIDLYDDADPVNLIAEDTELITPPPGIMADLITDIDHTVPINDPNNMFTTHHWIQTLDLATQQVDEHEYSWGYFVRVFPGLGIE